MQTLTKLATEIVTQGGLRNPTYSTITEYQREKLTAQSLKDLGAYAYEAITNAANLEKITQAAIEALEETDSRDRAVLERVIGQLVLEGVISECKKSVEDALDNAVTELALMRQFYDDSDYEYKRSTEPMRHSIYNHPEL